MCDGSGDLAVSSSVVEEDSNKKVIFEGRLKGSKKPESLGKAPKSILNIGNSKCKGPGGDVNNGHEEEQGYVPQVQSGLTTQGLLGPGRLLACVLNEPYENLLISQNS